MYVMYLAMAMGTVEIWKLLSFLLVRCHVATAEWNRKGGMREREREGGKERGGKGEREGKKEESSRWNIIYELTYLGICYNYSI